MVLTTPPQAKSSKGLDSAIVGARSNGAESSGLCATTLSTKVCHACGQR